MSTTLLHIPSMDCAVEEGEIRHALTNIAGIRSLYFQLAAHTLAIEASDEALQKALAAIRAAGFSPQPVMQPPTGSTPAHEHANSGTNRDLWRMVIALAAEMLAFFAADTLLVKLAGIALAATAIALAGLSTYGKGLAAMRRGRLFA